MVRWLDEGPFCPGLQGRTAAVHVDFIRPRPARFQRHLRSNEHRRVKIQLLCPALEHVQNGLRADLASYLDKNPKIKMFVSEGIQTKTPEGKVNDLKVTAQFMRGLGEFCEQRGVTIIGTAHVSKTREGERFLNPRQRIAGSVSWAGYSSTVVVIEEKDPESTGDARTISILRRNGKNDFFE